MRFTSKFKKKRNEKTTSCDKKDRHDDNKLQRDVGDVEKISKKKYLECRYCKLVPTVINEQVKNQPNLSDIYDYNSIDTNESRRRHLQIIAKFILSSSFCTSFQDKSRILQLKKKAKKEIKGWVANKSDLDTKSMLKISDEFHKIVRKNLHSLNDRHAMKKNTFEMTDECQRLSVIQGAYFISSKETIIEGPNGERQRTVREISRNNNSSYCFRKEIEISKFEHSCDVFNEQCFEELRAASNVESKERDESYTKLNKYVAVEKFAAVKYNEDASSTAICSEPCGMIEIDYPRRFGDVNERHCNSIMNLMNLRQYDRKCSTPAEVCIFFQEGTNDSGGLTDLKLDLAYKCLCTFFFPGKNIVTVSPQRDLEQFLNRTVFKNISYVRDLFGGRHYIDDDLKIRAVLMISKSISSLLRHQDVCLLDTLPLILGIDRDTLLILEH